MAQVSQELIDLLSVESLTAQIKDILNAIEAEKLIDDNSYTLEGIEYGKSPSTPTK
jgi:hypothetical protein